MTEPTSQELLQYFQEGKSRSADELFDRYVHRLIALTRNRISPKLARRVDPEDVVQSAYRSFFLHARDGDFALRRAGDLWRLLAQITLHKLHRQVERHQAQRRALDREESFESDAARIENRLVDREPTPDEAAAIAEQLQLTMQRATAAERQSLEMRLQGHTIEEIAISMNRSQRTVRRLLDHVRRDLQREFAAK